ncbi:MULTISPECIES: hypothetical protein [Vibrio]|uniref:SMODS and SLOG-associating 2TM effector domain-containing protein n=2 Tax=Vibrio TaxID=662 RepID=A0ABX3D3P5_9VIBR|nr:hypothetical protein [Vibrio rotiferianus]OHY89443.1 hypothetical protein BI375_23615 [Vibrio rotiferianus]
MSLSVLAIENISEVLAAIATATAGIAGFLSAYASNAGRNAAMAEDNSLNLENDVRLDIVRRELSRQKSLAKWQGLSATLLTISQYVVGGVLTTSFIQDMLSSQVVGFLGLLVLISSLIHQHFRPDLKARFAKERIVTLTDLERVIEDEIFSITSGALPDTSIYELRKRVTKALKEIELSELQDTGKIESEAST